LQEGDEMPVKITLPDWCRWCAQEYRAIRVASDDKEIARLMLTCVKCGGFRGYIPEGIKTNIKPPTEEDRQQAVAWGSSCHYAADDNQQLSVLKAAA
jgi:hypothetical protein